MERLQSAGLQRGEGETGLCSMVQIPSTMKKGVGNSWEWRLGNIVNVFNSISQHT